MRCARPMPAPGAREGDANVYRVLRSAIYDRKHLVGGALACVPPEWVPRLVRDGVIAVQSPTGPTAPAETRPAMKEPEAAAPSVGTDLPTAGAEVEPTPAAKSTKKRAGPAKGGTEDEE